MLGGTAALLLEKSGYLSEIDSRFGDGDHGVTMGKISRLIQQRVAAWTDESLYDFLDGLGVGIMGIGGGSAGPLYGTLIGGLALPLEGKDEIDAATLKAMLVSSRDEMYEISTARIGDKTMMDALIPAVDAALLAPDDVDAILAAAAEAAAAGALASEGFISKFGRAKSYKEQTIGTPDAGAVSTSLLFEGLALPVR
ncbi:MAG: dihydroxyacetone kinase subunit L [Oscillospiraceae bacterium]